MNQDSLNKGDELNLGRYLRLILLQSKIVVIFTVLGFFVSLALYLSTPNTYKISSLLQIYSANQSFDPRRGLSVDFFNSSDTNLDNLIALYSSRSNIISLIKDLNLNLSVDNLSETENFQINEFSYIDEDNIDEKIFYIETLQDSFSLFDEDDNLLIKGENGKKVENDKIKISLRYSNLKPDKVIQVTYFNPDNLYSSYKNLIKVNSSQSKRSIFVEEGLIQVHLITKNIAKGKNIIDSANKIFIQDSIKAETEKARKVISFIDNQLGSLEGVLDLNKSELKEFKQENKSLNVNLEVQSIINQIADIEEKISKVDLDLSQAEINFTTDNPLYINLNAQKKALTIQKNLIEQKIEDLPLAQQEYVDIYRDLEISEDLYTELANRKLNYSLIEASTIGNIRVVDSAFVDELVGPKLSLIFYLTLISFSFGILITIFRGIFFISISNPAELRDAGLVEDIVGVIPEVSDSDNAFKDKKFEQSIETLILNLETIISSSVDIDSSKLCKKIVFTSPTPSNGKSFLSRSFAAGLSGIGNKVLLIDADLKRGDQHKIFGKETIDLDFFSKLSLDSINSLKVENNLYFLPKLKRLKNTFEYFYGNLFLEKLKELEESFDYIIFDTAPALSVSDTGLLVSSSDFNFMIVRHQLSRINEIKQTNQVISQVGRSFDGVIYNGYKKPSGYYGYYDLYGDYSYRYYAERYLYDDYYEQNED